MSLSYMLVTFLEAFGLAVLIIIGIGFVIYKASPKIDSWEKGILRLFEVFADFLNFLQGKLKPEKTPNPSFILTREEVLALVEEFRNEPYVRPSLGVYTVRDNNDVSWLDVRAFSLTNTYADISPADLRKLAALIIRDFFIKSRNNSPEIFVKSVSPIRLLVAIPLTKAATEMLRAQEEEQGEVREGEKILEEKVLIPEDRDEDRI